MEDRDVVHILYVALREVGVDTELLTQEVQGVKCLGLGFCDRWNLSVSRKMAKAYKVSSAILEGDPLWRRLCRRLVEHEWSWGELLFRIFIEPVRRGISL